MLGIGLQHKTIDDLSTELELPSSQLLGLFNRLIKRCVQYFNTILEQNIEQTMLSVKSESKEMNPVAKSMNDELEEAAKVHTHLHLKVMKFVFYL